MDVSEMQMAGFLSYNPCANMYFDLRSTFATESIGEYFAGLSQCAWNIGVAL